VESSTSKAAASAIASPGRVPFVSFVLPVRNEERHLPACLASLAAQDYPRDRFEILVVDGRSTDRTREYVRVFAAENPGLEVRLLDNPAQGVAPGRNAGIRAARGEVIAFVEGHAEVDPGFLSEVAECLAKTPAVCLGRYVEQCLPEGTVFQRAIGLARKSRLGRNPHSGRFVARGACWMSPLGVATVYRREVFEQVGLYDESFITNEDVEFNYRVERAGLQAWYSPRLRYRLHPRESIVGLWRQMYRYGVGKRRFTRRHPEARRLAYLAPTLLCLSALSAAIALPFPTAAALLALPLAGYLAFSLLAAVRSVRRGLGAATLVPAAMLAMVFAFGLGYGIEDLAGRRHRRAAAPGPSSEVTRA